MLHPLMQIRPDGVIRSGIVQPYGVRHTSPVERARHTIYPFIDAVRGPGSDVMSYLDGMSNGTLGLGAVTVDRAHLLGLGAEGDDTMTKVYFGLGGLVLGVLGGYALTRVLRKRGRR